MSFVFPSWSTAFSPSFIEDAKAMLETALNKGNKPPVIQGRIEVVNLDMGTQPPTLTLLEIGDLSLDRFRGILRLGYQGDAWIEVRCNVQANPLSHNPNLIPSSTLPISTPLLASQPLLVPMTLRLSLLHLRAILILVVSASKGITLVFKNDPLQNVDVSSTFDSVEVIRGYLQQEIEGQLREMFREDLPGIIHRLSQRWLTGSNTGGTVETPYRDAEPAPVAPAGFDVDTNGDPDYDPHGREIFGPSTPASQPQSTPRRRALHRASTVSLSARERTARVSESPTSYTVFPDIENYDPTYGLRPEGLPTHSGYEAFGRLWEKARGGDGRGLGSLMGNPMGNGSELEGGVDSDEEPIDDSLDDEVPFFDDIGVDDSISQVDRRESYTPSVEWESFPAVGGGVITRPRVFHAQSQIRAPSDSRFGSATGSVTARANSIGASSTNGSIGGRPTQSAAGHMGYHPVARPSALRRTMTSHSDVFTNTRPSRGDSLTAYALQQAQALANRPASPMRSQSRSSMPPRAPSPPDPRERRGRAPPTPSPPPSPSISRQRPTSMDAGARLRSSPDPRPLQAPMPRHRATSVGTNTGAIVFPHQGRNGITLPLNDSVSHLLTLSTSANTLSPYARAHEHIAVRSFPHLGRTTSSAPGSTINLSTTGAETGEVKARRKRLFRLGAAQSATAPNSRRPSLSPEIDEGTPPLDWDDETTRHASSSASESLGRWKMPSGPPSTARASSRSSYGFPKIPE